MRTSIAMTTYNGKKYLRALLDSVRTQTVQPDEVIILDDRSTDGTYELVNEYIAKYGLGNWKNNQNETHLGWKTNFREVFKRCSGDLIFLCDQDDIWMKDKVEVMKNVMEGNDDIRLLVSNYEVLNVDRKEKIKIAGLNRNDGTVEKPEFKSGSLSVLRPGCTYCARRSLIEKLWDRDNINAPHDAMLWAYAAIEETLYLLNRKTIRYRRHSDSASAPKYSLRRTRRLEEVSFSMEMEKFFLEECRRNGYKRKAKLIEDRLAFTSGRKRILEEKSLMKMIWFQIRNHRHYVTARNMLSDDYVLAFRRR
ncbi:MAG: glycosyltransferase [Lachnospiraceae bacterium]|nr:glycosyltransferase [Lachnospiraceae bacterium]